MTATPATLGSPDKLPVIGQALAYIRAHAAKIRMIGAAIVVVIAVVAIESMLREFHGVHVAAAMESIPPIRIALALGLTALSYTTLTFYDVMALRIIRRPLPWRIAATASFASYTISHNLGLGFLTGGSARYRIYSAAGLDAIDIGRVIVIAGLTFWCGTIFIAALAMLVVPASSLPAFLPDTSWPRALGGLLAVALAAGWLARGPIERSWLGRFLPSLGTPRQAFALIAISTIDLAAASAALFVLLPHAAPALLPGFVIAYALAITVALVSHVPGGLGVFEAVILATVPADRAGLAAALIAYRCIYYLLPLIAASVMLAMHEWRSARLAGSIPVAKLRSLSEAIAPQLLALLTFAGAAVLLVSGATPAVPHRLASLTRVLPLPFVEATHFFASLAGTALLLLAPLLAKRLDGALVLARALFIAAALFSLAKGLDYEEAIICAFIAAMLHIFRSAFYRRTRLTEEPLGTQSVLAILAVVAVAIWIGFFAYRHVDYQDQLWWQFAWSGDASRFLRASVGVGLMLGGVAVWRLMAPSKTRPMLDDARRDTLIAEILATSPSSEANLALLGDKQFIVAPEQDAFLMYRVRGASWIVMGDPVGNPGRWDGLFWAIRSRADTAQGRLLFYQIGDAALKHAIALGLTIVKYGEQAIVPLPHFGLEGSARKTLRNSVAKLERLGAQFEVVDASQVPALIPILRSVSDQWLAAKRQKEKGFSLGAFDPDYLGRCDCAIVRIDGRVIAFANLWKTGPMAELSVDLMRHTDDAPNGTMDYLFIQLMLWGKAQGFEAFSLGIAPLSGIDGRRLAPRWSRVAALMFRYGDRFYGFRGLRSFKDKFNPVWRPRYIAAHMGLGFGQAMIDLQKLIATPRQDANR